MEKVELLNNIQKLVVDIHIKIYDLRNRIAAEKDPDIKRRAEKVLHELDEIQSSLHEQYNILDRTNNDTKKANEIENIIYQNLRSFDDVFKNAGIIFRSRQTQV
jgi:hypothetical protein